MHGSMHFTPGASPVNQLRRRGMINGESTGSLEAHASSGQTTLVLFRASSHTPAPLLRHHRLVRHHQHDFITTTIAVRCTNVDLTHHRSSVTLSTLASAPATSTVLHPFDGHPHRLPDAGLQRSPDPYRDFTTIE